MRQRQPQRAKNQQQQQLQKRYQSRAARDASGAAGRGPTVPARGAGALRWLRPPPNLPRHPGAAGAPPRPRATARLVPTLRLRQRQPRLCRGRHWRRESELTCAGMSAPVANCGCCDRAGRASLASAKRAKQPRRRQGQESATQLPSQPRVRTGVQASVRAPQACMRIHAQVEERVNNAAATRTVSAAEAAGRGASAGRAWRPWRAKVQVLAQTLVRLWVWPHAAFVCYPPRA